MKRIVFLSLHPEFGGGASANANILKMLCKKHEVFFIDEYLESTQKCLDEEIEKLTMIDFAIGKHKYYPWKINKVLKTINPDYIIIGFPFLLIFYWPILLRYRMFGSKIITVFHSLTLGENLKAKILDFLVALFSLVCNRLIFVSDFTRRSWNSFYTIRAIKDQSVIFNAVNEPEIIENHKNIQNIAYIGRLSDEKQPEIFCQLAKKAHIEKLSYKFIIWGDGPLKYQLIDKYSKYISFKGVSYNIDVLYKNIDLVIMTSKFENCPMVVLESKIRGIPSICPNVGGIPEIIIDGNDGKLLSDSSLETILKNIEIINKEYERYSANAIHNSKMYSINSIAEKWNEIIV